MKYNSNNNTRRMYKVHNLSVKRLYYYANMKHYYADIINSYMKQFCNI